MRQFLLVPPRVAAVVVVLGLITGQASSIPRDTRRHYQPASRALQDTIPLHKLFSQDAHLASLVDIYSHGAGGDTNEVDDERTNFATKIPPPPKFDINTFTFNKKNFRKSGDIFSLLADVEDSVPTKPEKLSISKQKDDIRSSTDKSSINVKIYDTTESKNPVVNIANSLGKNSLVAVKDLENLMSVIQQMKKKVQAKMGNSTSSTSVPVLSTDTASILMNLLLNTTKLEEIRTATLTSKSDDEFLSHLTTVLAGAETRSGSALTLDPVTIIALLTLAAYLIRAVYQILTVTSEARDVADLSLPLHLSDLPSAMVTIHNWISASEFSHVREKRSLPYVTTILDIPGNLAAIIKLHREGHQPCVRQFLCEQLQDRTFPEITLTDIFIAAMGYYFGDSDLANYIDNTLARSTDASCAMVPYGCSPRTLADAHYLENLYTRASYKFFNLLAAMTGLL
ncbi:hypothetical protein Pcinc_021976 [Petrolisthes cinctipes]|uniref:Uncharacterized protein n=1 Tax=Petrolisthes cinctipes TaxID=88211 RepID=A0AAE1FEY0_PETCI|nr:hypothetical protein Pcinc_021976 [Petrolisthes cinctipes]